MDFHIGASIVDRNGDAVGRLQHVIVDPETNEVVEIVLGESGLLGQEVLVPVGAVNSAERDFLYLELAKDQLDKLQAFTITRYAAPPAGAGAYPGMLVGPAMAPVGAASGIETIGMTPIVEVEEQIPEGDVDLEPGTEVWASDGKVGTVRDVLVDEETRRVRGIVIEKGILFHTNVEVDMDKIATVGTDRVTLKVSKAELQA